MYELELTEEARTLVDITKSDSGISGPDLAIAHMKLGALLANMLPVDPKDTTVIAILRGGIFFAEGIYLTLGCKFQLYDPKYESFCAPATKNIILVDSVINTGETIKRIYQEGMLVACCVVNEHTVSDFGDDLYTVRVSKNRFIGSNIKTQVGNRGPDTSMRLFNLL